MEKEAVRLLKTAYGETAEFRSGQWDAIDSVLHQGKTLVVQKTGWGKSLVYFLTTKLLRAQGGGPTILISPLLALMRNQVDAAERFGVRAEVINSDNEGDWASIESDFRDDRIDLLLISPERLGNRRFVQLLTDMELSIGMFVVDEAHCISDWGHDFRPDYRRIVRLIQRLAPNVPVLATTATANDRVVADIREQIGDELRILRGPLMRESLAIQVIHLPGQEARLAWLAENIPNIPRSGIIYCLTIADCRRVTSWLQHKGILAFEYHSRLSPSNEETNRLRLQREQQLMDSEIKVLVSTIALGMGFDKPDLGFVIHYQTPMNLVNYYQQIGRAGRDQSMAYAILLVGQEDQGIVRSMIDSAFPSIDKMREVLMVLEDAEDGLKVNQILENVNQQKSMVEKCLKHLELDQAVTKEWNGAVRYIRTTNSWEPDVDRMQRVTHNRLQEWQKMQTYLRSSECYMLYIARELNDVTADTCGHCANCIGSALLPTQTTQDLQIEAASFLNHNSIVIQPRRQWPAGGVGNERGRISPTEQNQEGRSLCLYYDGGYGSLVREGKYQHHIFSDELVLAVARLVSQTWQPNPMPNWVTNVPSRRETTLVADFSRRVASVLGIPFIPVLSKIIDTVAQKEMENGQHKAANVVDAFRITQQVLDGPVLLIDDVVDSGWTFTVCGVQLARAGSGPVYPLALADASRGGDGDS